MKSRTLHLSLVSGCCVGGKLSKSVSLRNWLDRVDSGTWCPFNLLKRGTCDHRLLVESYFDNPMSVTDTLWLSCKGHADCGFFFNLKFCENSWLWSVFFAQPAFVLWSAAQKKVLQVWPCLVRRTLLLLVWFCFITTSCGLCLLLVILDNSQVDVVYIFSAEPLWIGLEGFVFDWLINADR